MKKFLLSVCMCLMLGLQAEDKKSLDLSLGYGLYRDNTSLGRNISFATDYRFSKRCTLGQMSQFGFIRTTYGTYKANYINQHISLLALRNLHENRYFRVLAGTGLGYTNYHVVQSREISVTGDGPVPQKQTIFSTRSMVQMSFPVTADLSFKFSKTIAFGARFGGYVATRGNMFNYMFLNPQVKISL